MSVSGKKATGVCNDVCNDAGGDVERENPGVGSDLPLLFTAILLIVYAAYCIIMTVAYGIAEWGYALFYLVMGFVLVFIAKSIIAQIRLFMIVALVFFVLYVVFFIVGLVFYGYSVDTPKSIIFTMVFVIANSSSALILFVKLGWHRKITQKS